MKEVNPSGSEDDSAQQNKKKGSDDLPGFDLTGVGGFHAMRRNQKVTPMIGGALLVVCTNAFLGWQMPTEFGERAC